MLTSHLHPGFCNAIVTLRCYLLRLRLVQVSQQPYRRLIMPHKYYTYVLCDTPTMPTHRYTFIRPCTTLLHFSFFHSDLPELISCIPGGFPKAGSVSQIAGPVDPLVSSFGKEKPMSLNSSTPDIHCIASFPRILGR